MPSIHKRKAEYYTTSFGRLETFSEQDFAL